MNRKISLQLTDAARKNWTFEGIREFLAFCKTEADYWVKQRSKFQNAGDIHPFITNGTLFQEVINTINNWSNNLETWSDPQFSQQMANLHKSLLNRIQNSWLWSAHPFTSIFVECNREYGKEGATAFLDFIMNRQLTNISHKNAFVGAMLAYEFTNQDSDLTKRRNAEKTSLDQLRNDMGKTTASLIGEVENFKAGFNDWEFSTREEWAQWIDSSSEQHNHQQESQRNEFRDFIDSCNTRIEELEYTYQEKLRLEKPAEYWSKAAKRYEVQGGLWALLLVAWVVVALIYFRDFYIAWLQGHEVGVKLQTLSGVVLSVSIVTVFAFFAKTWARLAFSSFHLMRDAQEREQLTHLYLALSEGKQVDETSRDIVLQALFSRSETGLITSESGPTMPGVSELLKAATKS